MKELLSVLQSLESARCPNLCQHVVATFPKLKCIYKVVFVCSLDFKRAFDSYLYKMELQNDLKLQLFHQSYIGGWGLMQPSRSQ